MGEDDRQGDERTAARAASEPRQDDELVEFDQTNGVVQGLEGESDGTAEGDEESRADRVGENEPNPVGQQTAWRDDHYGPDDDPSD